jgi:hypothetical protein
MNVNPLLWFGEREVKLTPPHFTKCPTPLTEKSRNWVMSKTQSRYSICQGQEDDEDDKLAFIFEDKHYIYFEDPVEATVYELRWSGGK